MSLVADGEIALSVGVAGCISAYWFSGLAGEARRGLADRRQRARSERANLAAIEAAEDDDPSFAPEAVRQSVLQVLALVNRVWRGRTATALDERPDGVLIRAWARARLAWLGSGLRLTGNPSVELIRVANRAGEDEDRVVARVRLRIRCRRPAFDLLARRRVHLDERWTLGRENGRWVLLSMEGSPLAGPVLTAPLIPTPAHDTERLREESFAELASAQKVPADVAVSELVSADEPPAFALLDLSLIDGRFLPALIAAQLTHLVEAWEEAVTGSEQPLEELAGINAVTPLLRPAPGRRLIIRDAVMRSWEPIRLELSQQPPRVVVKLTVDAVRYVVTEYGNQRAGNDDKAREMVLTWTLELSGDTQSPWRLIDSTSPAEKIPGWSLI